MLMYGSSLRITCPYQFNLHSWTVFVISPTFIVSLILSFLILSSFLTPHIHRNIRISVTSNLCAIHCPCLCPVHQCWSYHCSVHTPSPWPSRSFSSQTTLQTLSSSSSTHSALQVLPSVDDFCVQFLKVCNCVVMSSFEFTLVNNSKPLHDAVSTLKALHALRVLYYVDVKSCLSFCSSSFFQSICVLGYCVLPLTIALILCRLILVADPQTTLLFIIRCTAVLVAFGWAVFGEFDF